MIEILKETFVAGETKTFMVQGEYLEILDAMYAVDVFMMDRSGAQLSTMRNAEASFFSRPGNYEVVQVYSANAQTIRLFIGSGDAGTRRISSTVQVVDGGKARTVSGAAFQGSVTCVGVAASYSHTQLWNPAGSGKNLIVSQFQLNSFSAQSVSVRAHNVALGALYGNCPAKKLGGAASLAELRSQTSGGYLPTTADMAAFYCAANSSLPFKYTEPVVIPPGQGLTMFVNNNVFTNLASTFEHYEEVI